MALLNDVWWCAAAAGIYDLWVGVGSVGTDFSSKDTSLLAAPADNSVTMKWSLVQLPAAPTGASIATTCSLVQLPQS